ncbi:MAG: ParB N-terminal domain-containing protein, partial [Pseudoxanthomonas sp.]
MNTVAVQTTQTQQAAVPAQNLLLVPLSQLRPSRRNVRKGVGQSVTALAASIQRVGLLQNLTVTRAADGGHYEAVAGGRRLAALKLLAKKRRIDKEYEVPCLLVADASALQPAPRRRGAGSADALGRAAGRYAFKRWRRSQA